VEELPFPLPGTALPAGNEVSILRKFAGKIAWTIIRRDHRDARSEKAIKRFDEAEGIALHATGTAEKLRDKNEW